MPRYHAPMSNFAEYTPARQGARIAVTIRKALTTDIPALERIQNSASRPAHAASYQRAIADAGRLVVVAELDGEVVGWGQTYHHSSPTDPAPPDPAPPDPALGGHYLGGVTVDPLHRRQGIAAALTEERMRWIAERDDEAFFVVNPQNQASIDLHKHWGFDEVLRADRLTGVTFSGGVGLLMRASLHP